MTSISELTKYSLVSSLKIMFAQRVTMTMAMLHAVPNYMPFILSHTFRHADGEESESVRCDYASDFGVNGPSECDVEY